MPTPIRPSLLGLALVIASAGLCSAQHPHGMPHPPASSAGHLGNFYQPFWGYSRHVGTYAGPHLATTPPVDQHHPGVGPGPVAAYTPGVIVAVPSWSGFSFFGGPSAFFPAPVPFTPSQAGPGGLWLSQPVATSTAALPLPRARANPSRAAELVELGDRAFRGGNFRKAEERYQLAIKADGESSSPHVRLAQVAIIRSNYARAAAHFREAVEAGGGRGWLLDAPDVQSLYGEPREFARRIAQLESHLQARPEDRDGWFVLGAERYLSGHPREAVDAFVRLADRPTDTALTAFQDAATVSMRSLARGDAADRDDP